MDSPNDGAAKDVIATGSIEPADDAPVGSEPVIGWRVWVLANNCLYSIAKNAVWQPGENQAECLVGHNKRDVPAPSCHCGFWALRNPVSAMQLAARVEGGARMGTGFTALDPQRTVAVGLIHGYGAIAVHGGEGYRAGLASVACIFADAPEELVTEKADLRRTIADEYGVPCIPLDAAISIGFLHEMGVGSQAVEQLKAWIAAGRPVPNADDLRLRWEVAWLLAQGVSEKEIDRLLARGAQGVSEKEIDRLLARAQGVSEKEIDRLLGRVRTAGEIARSKLNSRAAEDRIRTLIDGLTSRADLPRWVTKPGG